MLQSYVVFAQLTGSEKQSQSQVYEVQLCACLKRS